MGVFGRVLLVTLCLAAAACGSPEPRSPLILSNKEPGALPGPRDLTSQQSRSLQDVITSSGEQCGGITLAYLSGLDSVNGSESWEVRCTDAAYAVLIRSDGTPNAVRPCFSGGGVERPCASPYAGRPSRRQPQDGPLNPDLGKLLQPMIAKDGKTD
jgi:hypothetical protein